VAYIVECLPSKHKALISNSSTTTKKKILQKCVYTLKKQQKTLNMYIYTWLQWFESIIPAIWDAKAGGHPEPRSPRPAPENIVTPHFKKTQQNKNSWAPVACAYNPSYLGG
jgi:hypothetical protein